MTSLKLQVATAPTGIVSTHLPSMARAATLAHPRTPRVAGVLVFNARHLAHATKVAELLLQILCLPSQFVVPHASIHIDEIFRPKLDIPSIGSNSDYVYR